MGSKLTFWRLVILAVIVIAVMLFFGLRPKGLTFHNQVEWLEGQNGLRLGEYGMVYSNVAPVLPSMAAGNGFSIELAVRPSTDVRRKFKSLLMVHNGSDKDQLIVGQWKSALIVMNGDDYSNSTKRKRLTSRDTLKAGESRWISIVSKDSTVELYVDGKFAAKQQRLQLHMPQGNDRVYLVLGNSIYGNDGWDGEVQGLAVYAEALDAHSIARHHRQWLRDQRISPDSRPAPLLFYSFHKSSGQQVTDASASNIPLWIPKRPFVLKKTFLYPPWQKFRLNKSTAVDILMNFFGFVPLGVIGGLLMSNRRPPGAWRNLLTVIFACLMLSLFIESFQTWMPSRSSSMLDLILNTAGGAAGAGLGIVRALYGQRL